MGSYDGTDALASSSRVVATQKISDTQGGLPPILENSDLFGSGIAELGDLDGAGPGGRFIAVCAVHPSDPTNQAAVWLVQLTPAGTVMGTPIEITSEGHAFASAAADLGDLDGAGPAVRALAVGQLGHNSNRGRIFIYFLDASGNTISQQEISEEAGARAGSSVPGFTTAFTLGSLNEFGSSIALLGDLDGAGPSVAAVAVGATGNGVHQGAVYILFLDAAGKVYPELTTKIGNGSGGFAGTVTSADRFGDAIASLGDFDGPGGAAHAIAVGASQDNHGGTCTQCGSLWTIFLKSDGTVGTAGEYGHVPHTKIGNGLGNFPTVIDPLDYFGAGVTRVSDLDADGLPELLVGAYGDDDGQSNMGATWLVFLDATGGVKPNRVEKISATSGGFAGGLTGHFGFGIELLGDLNGDGFEEIGVGASRDDDNIPGNPTNEDRGAIFILSFADAACGNGFIEPTETCDDGDTTGGDGCSSTCGVEPGWTCVGEPSVCDEDTCGNGVVEGSETCDDGNTTPGDGCSSACRWEGRCADDQVCSGICDEDADCAPGCGDCEACGNGRVDPGEDCDDGNRSVEDGCGPNCLFELPPDCGAVPATGCRGSIASGKSSVLLKDRIPDKGDLLQWKWAKGVDTIKADFGNPLATTNYTLCVYDEVAGTPQLRVRASIPAGGTCAGKACWRESARGFKYADKDATPAGIAKLAMKAGLGGGAGISLQGRGVNLDMPILPLSQGPRVIVQLKNDTNAICWESRFSAPATANTQPQFRDKSD